MRLLCNALYLGLLCLLFLSAQAAVDTDTRNFLEALYASTGGTSSWVQKGGWETANTDPCTPGAFWYGLQCTGDQVIELDLSDNQLTGTIPTFVLPHATLVDLSDNTITTLPDTWDGLDSVNDLLLFNNMITALPDSWGGLETATTVRITNNQITSIPDSWDGLDMVKSLRLFDNLIEVIPETWAGLSTVEDLNLRLNPIKKIPETWAGLDSIRTLNLFRTSITALPRSWAGLETVLTLNLRTNSIYALPETWTGLSNVRTLRLHDNLVTELPPTWAGLETVRILTLDNNRITEIPASWDGLDSARTIELDFNSIATIPPTGAGLPSLEELYLTNNDIHGPVPTGFTGSPEIFLSDNKLCGSLPTTNAATTASGSLNRFDCTTAPPSWCTGCVCDSTLATCCESNQYRTPSGECGECDATCPRCQGPSRSECSTCRGPRFLDQEAGTGGEGTCSYFCSRGSWENTRSCVPCYPGCESCDGQFSNQCFTCDDGFFFQHPDNTCVETCAEGTYPSLPARVCAPCPHPCAECTAETTCTACLEPFLFDPSTSSCRINCPSGEFATAERECETCSSPCATCSSATFCTSCLNNEEFLDSETGECGATCPSGTYANASNMICTACNPRCDDCTGPGANCE